ADGPAPGPLTARPRWLHLDPSAPLPPASARVDQLARAILAEPVALSRAVLPEVAARAARSRCPAASRALIQQALERIKPWAESALGRRAGQAREVRRALAWSIAWPPGSDAPTVIQGRVDYAFRDPEGWSVVNLSDPLVPEP